MAKSSLIQNAFNGGQFGPRMQGRTDLARYRTGCNELRNFLLTMQGPAVKRSGTRFIRGAKNNDKKTRLISFEFSREQAYTLEFGDLYMRVYRDGGVVLLPRGFSDADGASINSLFAENPYRIATILAHGLTTGDQVFVDGSNEPIVNGRWFTVTVVNATEITLDGEDGTTYSASPANVGSVSTVFEVATPYTEAQLFDIQTAQSQDVLYLAHPDVPPQKISRTSDFEWTVEEIDFKVPPFRAENLTDTTMSAGAATGTSITITASEPIFTGDMAGTDIKFTEIPAAKYLQWPADQDLALAITGVYIPGGTGNVPDGNRVYFDNNVYQYETSTGARTGVDPPVHLEGTELDQKVNWSFVNQGFGHGTILLGALTQTPVATCTIDVDTNGIELPRSIDTSTHADVVGMATKRWAFSAWSPMNGYPRAVAFFEDRLWWAGTDADPQTFWGSRTSQYEDHTQVPDEADSAVQFTLASDKINSIEWMSGDDQLFIGTRGSEYTADSGSAVEAITPSNIRVRRRSNYGSAPNIQPLAVDSAILFMHRSARRLHELIAEFDSDLKYLAPDLTDLSYDILEKGVVELAYQASPFRMVWALLNDGTLAALTYIRDQDVIGWAPHVVGGTDAFIESIAVIPHPDDDEDQLWMVIRRTVDGQTVRYIETLEKPFESGDDPWDAFHMDSGLTLRGSTPVEVSFVFFSGGPSNSITFSTPHGFTTGDRVQMLTNPGGSEPTGASFIADVTNATQIELQNLSGVVDNVGMPAVGAAFATAFIGVTELDHLEGETVSVMGSGVDLGTLTVSGGAITLPSYASIIHVGLAMPVARLQTMRPEVGQEMGTAQGRKKRPYQLVTRVDSTGPGLKFGTTFEGTLDPWDIPWREAVGIPLLETGDTDSLEMPNGWEREGRIALTHEGPHPCTIVALMPQIDTQGRG